MGFVVWILGLVVVIILVEIPIGLVTSCFVVTRRLRRRPERSHVIDRGRFDLGEPQKTVQRSGLCEFDDHVLERGFGLGAVPRLGLTAVGDVVGVVAVQGVPDDDDGLHQHPERHGALDRVR